MYVKSGNNGASKIKKSNLKLCTNLWGTFKKCLGLSQGLFFLWKVCTNTRTTDTQKKLFSKIPKLLVLGRHFGLKIFWGIWGIFDRTISTHFGTVSSLSMFSIIQPLFLQKTKPLYYNFLGPQRIWDLAFMCP